MKTTISILIMLFILICAGSVYAVDGGKIIPNAKTLPDSNKDILDNLLVDDTPPDIKGAIDMTKKVIDQIKAKQWFAFSAGMIWIIMFVLKFFRKRIPMMQKINKRWLYITVCLLSVVAMLLTRFQAELSWEAAITVLFSGPSVAYLNDLLKRGILGKSQGE